MEKNRRYLETHPWITFSADFHKASHKTWMLLGEAQSKCEHLAGTPLIPAFYDYLNRKLMVKGIRGTAAIEGNTLTEEQVGKQLEGKLELPESQEYLAQEIENLDEAFEYVLGDVLDDELHELSVEKVCVYNKIILKDLKLEKGVVPGKIRDYSAGVMTYRGAPPEDCYFLLEELLRWIQGEDFLKEDMNPIIMGLIKAVLAHLYFEWIHPFGDGNGRTGRLIEYQILVCAGVPAPAAHLLSNHYNLTRSEYYRQLDMASKSGGDIFPFIEYALQGFVDGLRDQIKLVKFQQWEVSWQNYVHERIPGKGVAAERQRKLMIDLSENHNQEYISIHEATEITPRIIKAYSGQPKAIFYDLKKLEKVGLIERKGKTFKLLREVILAFLPQRSQQPPK